MQLDTEVKGLKSACLNTSVKWQADRLGWGMCSCCCLHRSMRWKWLQPQKPGQSTVVRNSNSKPLHWQWSRSCHQWEPLALPCGQVVIRRPIAACSAITNMCCACTYMRKQMWRASVIQTPTLEVQAGVSHLSAVKWLHKIMRHSIRYSISEGLCIYDYLCSQWLCHAMPFQSFCRIMSCFSGLRFLCLSRPEGLPPVNFSSFSLCDAVDVWWQVMTLSYTLSWHHWWML